MFNLLSLGNALESSMGGGGGGGRKGGGILPYNKLKGMCRMDGVIFSRLD